ncbi:MAG: hypothetical protein KY458_00515 [Actinobacteria bacterium]|nr:hypothetical protein [Actinomycetota bacterium]
MSGSLLAALAWDPQIRGALIVLTSFVILPGSVFMLLSTNTGARLGFLLAAAGLTGWMAVMGWIWVAYGIGIKGDPPTWKVHDVVTGSVSAQSTYEPAETFPRGWKKLKPGDPVLADATAAAGKVLAPAEEGGEEGGGHGGEEAEVKTERTFEPAFDSPEDYAVIGGFRKGGESYFLPGGLIEVNDGPFKGWLHKPHYVVLQARPVIKEPSLTGAPVKPAPDPTMPPTSVIMVRDLGRLRFPSTMVALSMTIVFMIVCNALHRRDKQVMAARAALEPATG